MRHFCKKDDTYQINTLIYCMGNAADDILTSLSLTTKEENIYKTMRDKLEVHFIKRQNVSYIAMSIRRIQQEDKSIDCFITTLHCLVEHCNYELLCNNMIHDRNVVSLLYVGLSIIKYGST